MEITIIIPTYRPQNYIFECLIALKNQSLPKEEFEVLVVLNGEKEPYYTNIYNFIIEKQIANIRLMYIEENGVSKARNIGLNNAKGKYVTFIDDDDYVDNNYLEVMYNVIKTKKDAISCTNYRHFDEKTLEEIKCTRYLWGDETTKIEKYRKVFSSIGAKLIPISIIENIRFNEKLKNSEDALFMTLISKNIKEICIVSKKTYYNRRVRAFSANKKKKPLKEIIYVFMILIKVHLALLLDIKYNKVFIFLRILAIFKGTLYQLKRSL